MAEIVASLKVGFCVLLSLGCLSNSWAQESKYDDLVALLTGTEVPSAWASTGLHVVDVTGLDPIEYSDGAGLVIHTSSPILSRTRPLDATFRSADRFYLAWETSNGVAIEEWQIVGRTMTSLGHQMRPPAGGSAQLLFEPTTNELWYVDRSRMLLERAHVPSPGSIATATWLPVFSVTTVPTLIIDGYPEMELVTDASSFTGKSIWLSCLWSGGINGVRVRPTSPTTFDIIPIDNSSAFMRPNRGRVIVKYGTPGQTPGGLQFAPLGAPQTAVQGNQNFVVAVELQDTIMPPTRRSMISGWAIAGIAQRSATGVDPIITIPQGMTLDPTHAFYLPITGSMGAGGLGHLSLRQALPSGPAFDGVVLLYQFGIDDGTGLALSEIIGFML